MVKISVSFAFISLQDSELQTLLHTQLLMGVWLSRASGLVLEVMGGRAVSSDHGSSNSPPSLAPSVTFTLLN